MTNTASTRQHRIAAYATRVLPVAAFGMARLLDQSMRRPSVAGLLLHSLRVIV